jgi:hypothetical protein
LSLALVPTAPKRPEHVVILGLGPSLEAYVDITKRLGGRRRLADEVWGINAVGDVIACDRVFHMDDVRIQEIRAEAAPESNIAVMLKWMKTHPGPIYTSRLHPDYPGLVEFPLQDVINNIGHAYFNGTCAYAVALAIHMGVKRISLFGTDYTYANSHLAEKGRANVEFLLGIAYGRGIEIIISEKSSLLDTCEGLSLYGYGRMGSLDVDIEDVDGSAKVRFTERAVLPTAEQIEAEYDHGQSANPLVRAAKSNAA